MFKVVKKSEASVRQISPNKVAYNYVTKDFSKNISLAVTEGTEYNEKESSEYNRIYYVLEGTLTLVIEGNEILLEPGDSCYLEKGTEYEMRGTFKAVTVNQPAFGSL